MHQIKILSIFNTAPVGDKGVERIYNEFMEKTKNDEEIAIFYKLWNLNKFMEILIVNGLVIKDGQYYKITHHAKDYLAYRIKQGKSVEILNGNSL